MYCERDKGARSVGNTNERVKVPKEQDWERIA